MKQTLITITICAIFTVINFGFKTEAQSESLLDYSSVSNGIITIGNENVYITLNTNNNQVEIEGENLFVYGNDNTNGSMYQIYLDASLTKFGDLSPGGNGTLLSISDEGNEITASPKIAGHQLEP